MNKTFKKAIAVILSVLMVVLSVPFTALAAPGDYEPNAKMYFGTFVENNASGYTDYSTCGTGSEKFDSAASLYGAPVDYTYKVVDGKKTSGTLSINKDKANTFNAAIESPYEVLSKDIQLGVGDYFTMTLNVENLTTLSALLAQIQFSDSIEPAGIYSYKSGRKTVYKLGTESERAAAKGTWEDGKGGTNFLPLYSMCKNGIDKDVVNNDLCQKSAIIANNEDGKMNVINYAFACPNVDITGISDPDGLFVDPTTGDASGYTYTNSAPVATFVFKIVTDDPIEFSLYNSSNIKSLACVANSSDGTLLSSLTTYAKNVYNEDTNTNDGDVEHPGSKKFTFMGFNEFREAPKPSTYTIKFVRADGVDVPSQTVNAGEKPAVPDSNTAQTVKSDNAGHHTVTTYTWPTVEAATADRVYDEVPNPVKSDCHYTETVEQQPTYTEPGLMRYTCDVCGHSYTAEIPVKDCKHADTKVVNATKPTINNAGNTGDTVCNVCGKTIKTGTVIPQLKGEAYRAALKAAKDVDGSKYTADSYAKVTKALADYDEATVGAYTSQEDVDAAEAALKAAVEGLVANPTTETYTYNFIDGTSKPLTVNKGETPENFANTPAKVTDNKNGTHTTTTYTWSKTGEYAFTEVGNDKVDDCKLKYETVTQPTIKVEGSKSATCPDCGYVSTLPIDKLDGTAYNAALKDAQSKNAKDYTEASYAKVTAALKDYAEDVVATYTDPADVAKATKALEDAVAQLDAGVVVTVASTKLGTTTLNDADATNGANARLAVGDKVVLTAKANNETGEFVGWKVGNKIVSDEASFVTYATADITYEPVFAEKADTSFTVVFVDPYGNVIDTQTVTSGANIEIPTAPTLIGYTFTGWSMTEPDIHALTDGATIYAQYTKDNVAKYTVTAPEGATLTVDGVETASPATVAYDAKVSVHKDGVAAWQVDGVTVAYGDTYTFFCGSDMNLVAVDTAVEQKTTVVITGVNEIAGSVQVSFAASRNVAPGETVVKQGFIYGKNLADSELTLENVGNKGADANAGTVKIAYTKNSAADISLRYGLSKKDGKVSAAAFVITKTADGTLNKTISEVKSYTYH
ncbi:MAG: hypothetical protein V8R56_04890 [Eubacterium sp.]